jgi:hypothetical protein
MRSDRWVITDDVDAWLLLATGAAGVGLGAGAGAEVDGGAEEETYVEEALADDKFEELEACNMERDALESEDLGWDTLPDTAEEFEGFAAEDACTEYSAFPDNIPLITAAASDGCEHSGTHTSLARGQTCLAMLCFCPSLHNSHRA